MPQPPLTPWGTLHLGNATLAGPQPAKAQPGCEKRNAGHGCAQDGPLICLVSAGSSITFAVLVRSARADEPPKKRVMHDPYTPQHASAPVRNTIPAPPGRPSTDIPAVPTTSTTTISPQSLATPDPRGRTQNTATAIRALVQKKANDCDTAVPAEQALLKPKAPMMEASRHTTSPHGDRPTHPSTEAA